MVSVAGSELAVESTGAIAAQLSPMDFMDKPAPTSMRQKRQQGYEQTVITGADPSVRTGHAATFVALCALMAGPGPNLPSELEASGNPTMVSINRTLEGGSPVIVWTVITPAEGSVLALQELAENAADVARAAIAEPTELIAFARANLNRPWSSPRGLAQAMAEYEVMGWGGQLIRDPDAALESVRPRLREAFARLLRPVTDVLGQPSML
ncbi:MAG: hypothetical protein ACK5KK_10720 [Microbacterium sp.]